MRDCDDGDILEQPRKTAEASAAGQALANAFAFLEAVFGEGQEILLFVTELTENFWSSQYIAKFGCERYFAHNKELLFYERQREIVRKIENG